MRSSKSSSSNGTNRTTDDSANRATHYSACHSTSSHTCTSTGILISSLGVCRHGKDKGSDSRSSRNKETHYLTSMLFKNTTQQARTWFQTGKNYISSPNPLAMFYERCNSSSGDDLSSFLTSLKHGKTY
jgi:hypothetical protein